MIRKNEVYLLLLILIFALLVRIPGVFFGYHVFGDENIAFITDEAPIANMADEFLSKMKGEVSKKPIVDNYVKGLSFQISLLAFPLTFFMKVSLPILGGLARGLSLIYGLLTIILVFFISLKIFHNKKIAFLSSLFLAISGLHITFSHIGKPDIALIFWIYFTFLLSYMYVKDKKVIYIILASMGAGFAGGIKFAVIPLIPLIYIFFKEKHKMTNLFLIFFVVVGSFAVINGFSYTSDNFLKMVKYVNRDNDNEYNKLMNPPLNTLYLLVGVGIFVFLLFIYGIIVIIKKIRQKGNSIVGKIDRDFFFIFVLPLIFYLIIIFNRVYAHPRHVLQIIPLFSIIAAYGFYNLKLNKKTFTLLLVFIIAYQSVYILAAEINYVSDTREGMGEWMLENIELDSKIYIGEAGNKYLTDEYFIVTNKSKISKNRAINRQGIVIPSEFRTVADFNDADYIMTMKDKTYFRSPLNPLGDPICNIERLDYDYDECVFRQILFRNGFSFRIIKRIETYSFMPEFWIYKKLLLATYSNGVEDVYLFKKIK